jgi:hypothetical protein
VIAAVKEIVIARFAGEEYMPTAGKTLHSLMCRRSLGRRATAYLWIYIKEITKAF